MSSTIVTTPVFWFENGHAQFEGLQNGRPVTQEYRFIVDTLRKHFGDDLNFEYMEKGLIKVHGLSAEQIEILAFIRAESCDRFLKYGPSQLTFTINK
jgi:hypothetical protein